MPRTLRTASREVPPPSYSYDEIRQKLIQEDTERKELLQEALSRQDEKLMEIVAPHIVDKNLLGDALLESVELGKEGLLLIGNLFFMLPRKITSMPLVVLLN